MILELNTKIQKDQYTQDQINCLTYFESNFEEKEILIQGYAGTGKTTIVENIIKHFCPNKFKKCFVLAPTNKAVLVLNSKIQKYGSYEFEIKTLHSFLYGEPDSSGDWIVGVDVYDALIIVDEASMINKQLHQDLIKAIKTNCLLIFLGDSFQLEQIGEKSDIWNIKTLELKEVKRTDGEILNLATLIRNENKNYYPAKSSNDIEILKLNDAYDQYYVSLMQKEDSVFIVATNELRNTINELMHLRLYDYNIVPKGMKMIAIANSTTYVNGEIFTVEINDIMISHNIELIDKYDTYKYKIYIGFVNNVKTIFIPKAVKPSIYHHEFSSLGEKQLKEIFDEKDLIWDKYKRQYKLSKEIVIATYGYCISSHKAQGSQFTKVFVYQNYSAPSWNSAKWFYTAITRAVKKLIIVPNGKYQLKHEM